MWRLQPLTASKRNFLRVSAQMRNLTKQKTYACLEIVSGNKGGHSVRRKKLTIDKNLRTIKHIFFLTTFLSVNLFSFSQTTPLGLKDKSLQDEILNKTTSYDSLIFFDQSSYWGDDHAMTGFAFKKGSCYKTKIYLDKGNKMFELKFNRIEYNKDQVYDNLKDYIISKFNALKILNNDSLNIKSRTNTAMDVSDQTEATIIILIPKRKEFIYKNSYAPDLYQKIVPTTDRQVLIDIFARLKEHIK